MVLHKKRGAQIGNMLAWANHVKSGDPENLEARAAVYYRKLMFPAVAGFTRDREGAAPNNLLNYGYAILRAIVARSLVSSGLLATLGIHHKNRYNAYCLADDIMEPYRPYVDELVVDIVDSAVDTTEINKSLKAELLRIPVLDVTIGGQCRPLMVAVAQTTASLYKCYKGELRKMVFPIQS